MLALLVFANCSDDPTDPVDPADTPADVGDTANNDVSDDAEADIEAAGLCEPGPECGPNDEQPPRLSEHAAAYLDAFGEMIVFGGTTGVPDNCNPAVAAAYVDDTWVYDDSCGTWRVSLATGPTARGRHSMAASGDAVWMFGGRFRPDGSASGDYTLFDELWRLDGNMREWELAATGGPAARVNALLVWDSTVERLVLFGGNDSESGMSIGPRNDVWEFDPAEGVWSELSITGTPPAPRLSAAGTYDVTRHRVIVYGGFDSFDFGGGVEYFSDVWALDLNSMEWEQLANSSSGPDGRFGSAMVHDTTFDNYVLFGGHDDQALGNRNDAWLFFPETNNWGLLGIGDEFNSPQIDFCEFPPDFTTIDPALPERRNYHSFVWSEACGRGLVFGGKTDCGSANDVWSYADEQFEEAVTATAGEVCVRFRNNPDNCANLCF